MKLHRSISTLFVPALAALLAISPALAAGRVIWKSETMAQLKLQGRVPKTWNVYTGDKKKNLVLTLVGRRYLALDLKAHTVYELDPKSITPHGDDLESDDPAAIGRLIPSSEWTERDVGPAERVLVTLGDYGKVLELELPHVMDLRRGVY